MTLLVAPAPSDDDVATTCVGLPLARVVASGVVVGLTLLSPMIVTTASGAVKDVVIRRNGTETGTGGSVAGQTMTQFPATAMSVRELRARSGWTWDELAKVFGVSRRAVHGWATGTNLNHAHAVRLQRLTAVVDGHDLRDAVKTRAAMHAPVSGGRSTFEQLVLSARRPQIREHLTRGAARSGAGRRCRERQGDRNHRRRLNTEWSRRNAARRRRPPGRRSDSALSARRCCTIKALCAARRPSGRDQTRGNRCGGDGRRGFF